MIYCVSNFIPQVFFYKNFGLDMLDDIGSTRNLMKIYFLKKFGRQIRGEVIGYGNEISN